MRPGAQLLLTILVVVVGLVVYDLVRGDASPPGGGGDASTSGRARTSAAPGPQATLAGRGTESILLRLDALERELAALRGEGRGGGVQGASDPARPVESPSFLPEGPDASTPGAFDEDALATLDAYQRELDRRRSHARRARQLTSSLERAVGGLTDEQYAAAAEATLAYEAERRALMRQLGYVINAPPPPNPREVQDALDRLRASFRDRLGEQFGSATASEILEAGYTPRIGPLVQRGG